MRKLFKALAISALLMTPASLAQAQVTFGVRIGEPPPARAYRVPAYPGAGYEWVEGYWYPRNGHYVWRDGYWARPPYQGAYWSAPYYSNGRYFAGRWDGNRRNRDRDHDRDRDRHYDRRR